MTCYIVTFQTDSEASRNKVREVLKTYPSYCPIHNYCWAILSEDNAKQIRGNIQAVMSTGERGFVMRSGTEASWFNSYSEKNNEWLKEKL